MGITRAIHPDLEPVEFPDEMDEAAVDAYVAQNSQLLRQKLIARRQAQLASETEGDEALRYATGEMPLSERVISTVMSAPQSAMRQTGQTLRGLGEFLATAPIPRERGEIAPEIVRENIRRAQRPREQVEREVEASPTRRLGGEMVAAAPEAFPTLPGVRESLPSQVSGGIGSVGALLPAGLTGPAAPFVGGAMYGLSAGEDFADDAEQVINSRIAEALAQGNTEVAADLERRKFDMKNTARMAGRGVGTLTQAAFGVGSNIRLGKSQIGGIGKRIAERLVPKGAPEFVQNRVRGAAEGFVTEAAQEMSEQALGNAAAKAVYDPNRKLTEGVVQSGVVGGLTGNVVGGAFGSRRDPNNPLPASRAAVAGEVVPGTEIPQDIGAPDLTLEDLGDLLPVEAGPEAVAQPGTPVPATQETPENMGISKGTPVPEAGVEPAPETPAVADVAEVTVAPEPEPTPTPEKPKRTRKAKRVAIDDAAGVEAAVAPAPVAPAPTSAIPLDDTAMEAATAAATAPRTPAPITTAPDEGIAERAAVDEEMTRATTRVPEVAPAQVGMPDEGIVATPVEPKSGPVIYESGVPNRPFALQKGEKPAPGDLLFATREEAEKEFENAARIEAANKATREKWQAKEAEEKAAQAVREDLDGYEATLSPMQRARAVKALTKAVKYKGKEQSIRDVIRGMVADGATVKEDRLERPDGSFLGQKTLTKMGLDYARHLAAKREPTIPPLPTELAEAIAADEAPDVFVENAVRKFGEGERAYATNSTKPNDRQRQVIERGKRIAAEKGWDWNKVKETARRQLGLNENFLKPDSRADRVFQMMREEDAAAAKRNKRTAEEMARIDAETKARRDKEAADKAEKEATQRRQAEEKAAADEKEKAAAVKEREAKVDRLVSAFSPKFIEAYRNAKTKKAKAKLASDGLTEAASRVLTSGDITAAEFQAGLERAASSSSATPKIGEQPAAPKPKKARGKKPKTIAEAEARIVEQAAVSEFRSQAREETAQLKQRQARGKWVDQNVKTPAERMFAASIASGDWQKAREDVDVKRISQKRARELAESAMKAGFIDEFTSNRFAEPPAAQAAEVATPEVVKQSKPPMAPKAQKAFLLEEIDKALEEAPDPESRWEELADKWNASPEKAAAGPDTKAQAAAQKAFMDAQPPAPVFDPFIIIEVPGNGTFKINNTKRALKAFKERAKKFPTDTAGPTRTPLPAKGQSKPAAIGKNTKETFLATAKDFVSDDPDRNVLHYVMSDGRRSAATDGRVMLVWDEPVGGKNGEQKLFGLDGKEVKADQSLNIPNWNSVIPKSPEVVFKKLNTERLFGIVKQAIAGPKEIDVGKRRTEEVLRNVHILSNPDGSIGVFSESQFGDYVHNVQKGAKNISKVDGERLLDIVQAARRLGSESVSMSIDAQDAKTPLVFKWDGAQAILMPLGNVEPGSTLQSLTAGEKQPDILERALNAAIKATDRTSATFSDPFLIAAVGLPVLNAALRIVRRVYLKTRDLARAKRQGMRLIRRQLRSDKQADIPRIEEAFNQLVEGTSEKPGPDQIEAFQAADGTRRQKSRGLFTGDVTVDTDAEWQAGAERWINQFNGNIRRAFEAARSTDYATTGLNPAAQDYVFGRLLELTEIQANAARNDVDALRAINLQKEIADAMRLASSEAGKALGARALVQNRLLWMFPVLNYRNLIREAQKRLPFPDVVADEVRTWLQESGRRAVQEMRNAMTDADKVFARELKTTVRDMRVVWRDVMTASVESQEAMRRKILEELVKAPELKGLSRQGYIDIANLLGKAWERERARIFAAEFRKQVPLPTVKEDVRRKLFTAIPDVLKWANLGLLDNEAFRNAVAPKFGVAKFNGETAKKLNTMAQQAQRVGGVNRNRIIAEMYDTMQREGGVRWPDIVRDYWYAAVLGAVNTQVDNALGVINGALNTVMGMAMSPPEVRKAMGKAYKEGFGEAIADFFPILWRGDVARAINFNPEQPANTLNALSKSGNLFARGLSVGKYVSRLMTALDQVNALSMDQAAKAYAIGRRYPIEHLRRYMMPSENVLRTARLKAEAEGTPPNLMRKRVREIVQESIPVEVLISSKDIRELVTFTNQPKGLMGALYRGVQEMEKKAPGFKVLSGTNFLRFAANYSNEILNYVAPVALYRYYVSAPSRAGGRLGLKMGQEERQLILAKLAVGTALGTFAAALFLGDDDDEKDRKIDITGSFKSLDPNKRKQLLSEGRAPYSIRIGDKYVSYRQLPFGGVLGAIGELRDRQLYNPKEWDQESIARKFVDGAFAGSLIVRDSPAISSFTEFLGTANAYKYDMNEQVEKSLPKYIARLGGSFIPRIAKEIDAWADPAIYKANTGHEFFLQQMPIFRRELGEGPVLNVLGEPVQVERYPWSRWIKTRKEDKAWSTLGELASKGVFMPVPSVTVKVLENGKRREMTPAESYRYQQRVGQAYRKFVEDNAERLLRMKPDEATDFIDTQTERIRSRIRAGGA